MEILDLTDLFTTKSQAKDFLSRITLIISKVYEKEFNLEKALEEQFGVVKKDAVFSFLRKNEVPLGSTSAIINFLEKIQERVSSLPTAYLTIAIEPDEKTLKTISNWFLLNLKRQVLLDITVDPQIIGGASIAFQGKQKNASIRSLFESVSSEVLENFNSKTKI